jgi:hypothetical protein
MAIRVTGIILLIGLISLIGSCGGSQPLDVGAAAVEAPAIDTGTGEVPSIPLDRDVSGDPLNPGDPPDVPVTRHVWGREYLVEHNGTVHEDSLILDPGDERLAWAIYRFSELADLKPQLLSVEALPGDWGDEYWIGVANYTTMTWEWFGPADLIEYEIDLAASDDRYVTHQGNFYFVMVVHSGNVYTHVQSTLTLNGYDHPIPPGPPYHLAASDGEFSDHVAVGWQPGAGAQGYEVWRAGPSTNPPGPDGGDPDHGGWMLVGTPAGTHFDDFQVVPGNTYWYKARSVADGGLSDFSNIDPGFAAGGPPPPATHAIHGLVLNGEQQGVAGVNLYIIGPAGVQTTQTHDDGHYLIENLGPGVYIVAPHHPLHYFHPLYLIVELNADHPSAEADFQALGGDLPVHRLWGFTYGVGTPTDPDGAPHDGPLGGVTLTIANTDTDTTYETTSSHDGYWNQPELPDGGYLVHPGLEGYEFDPHAHDAALDGEHVPPPLIFYGYYGHVPGDPQP